MKQLTFITGNQRKADYLAKWLDWPVTHHKLDLDEIQSLNSHTVAEHKVRQAYGILKSPVLVEDTSLVFTAMGRLPGTFIKWFLEELGNEGLCKVADTLPHRSAVARVTYAYCSGDSVHFFEGSTEGNIAAKPRGAHGMGWDPVFIPNGSDKTFAEMSDHDKKRFSPRAKAHKHLHDFLLRQV
ncbi:MAG: non-canonical purine NTP pyrophosphatase [Candidatus Saccharimonadales bacterium]